MFAIDRQSQTPVYEQVIAQAETLIEAGYFAPNEPLPSVRTLARDLSINPNTLQKAYAELERKQLCYTVPGSGRYVSEKAVEQVRRERRNVLPEIERLSRQLKKAGVPLEELMERVRAAYDEGGNEYDKG
ncbi:MAG: GntR family transcriptional regulator [Clostridia bacterium]|nr:GntR family transcriptional regulator [Clostridia bacterium]